MKAEGKIMSFEGSSRPRSWVLLAAAAILLALGLALAPAAQARDSFALAGSYDFGGQFGTNGPGMMDIHQATDTLYVVDAPNNRILKFDISDPLNPVPENFSALSGNEITQADGSPLVLAAKSNIAVDNSGGPQDGTIYLATNTSSAAHAYSPSGTFLYVFAHDTQGQFSATGTPQPARAIAVANSGPNAGEIFRFGTSPASSASYSPSLAPSQLPEVNNLGVTGGTQMYAFDSWGAGYRADGEGILVFGGLFGLAAYLVDAQNLSYTGQFSFGQVPFDVEVTSDGTVLGRFTAAGGSIRRFRQVGIQNLFAGETGTELVEEFGFGQQGTGVGMAESDQGYIFVTDAANARINVFAPATAPDAEMEAPGFVDLNTAELRATVNAQGLNLTNCEFQWGTTVAYSNPSVPCDVTPTGSADVQVSAPISVTARTTYQSRIVLSADNGTATYSTNLQWQAPDLPEADTLAAGPQQRKGTVVLGGTVDPNQTPAGYYIEYSSNPGLAGARRHPAQENVPAGNGDNPVRVHQTVSGLDNDTTYYFRVVAETKAGTHEGPIESFRTFTEPSEPQPSECANARYRTGQSALLPDCRAWEQVSPVDKNGGSISQGQIVAAENGLRVTYGSTSAFSGQQGLGAIGMYLADRIGGDWETSSISPPFTVPSSQPAIAWIYRSFTPDLGRMAGSSQNVKLPGVGDVNTAAYLWDTGQASVSGLVAAEGAASVRGVTLSDTGETGTISGTGLTPVMGPTSSGPAVYWWAEQESSLELASKMPNGDPTSASNVTQQAMSRDGQFVLWAANSPQGRAGSTELYLSKRGGATNWVSDADGAASPAQTTATIAAYTPDLEHIYFRSAQRLTPDSQALPGVPDLYRFELDPTTGSGQLEDLTTADSDGGGAEEVVGLSDDGAVVYFLATGNLTPEATGSEQKLYVAQGEDVELVTSYGPSLGGTNVLDGYQRLTRTSSDGRFLLFPHRGNTAGTRMESVYETGSFRTLYRYDLLRDRMDCVSCHPEGKAANSDAYLTMPERYRPGDAGAPGVGPERYFMSDQGNVMFVTAQGMVARDVNNRPDTYLWDGNTRLLTNGTAPHAQWAEDATEGFDQIFVLTPQQLVPRDRDQAVDLYVAPVGGGLPHQQSYPHGKEDSCAGDSCQGLGEPPPPMPRLDSPLGSKEDASGAGRCARLVRSFMRKHEVFRKLRVRAVSARKATRRAIKRHARRQASPTVRTVRLQKRRAIKLRKDLVKARRGVIRSRATVAKCRGDVK